MAVSLSRFCTTARAQAQGYGGSMTAPGLLYSAVNWEEEEPGFARNVSTGASEVMVNFVTSLYKPELLEPLVNKITKIPEVVSIMNNVNTSVGNTSVGEEEYTLYGKPTITEMLRGLTFQISANSFFQTNTKQADVLYKLIGDSAGLKGDGSEIILDLFCGTGTIGLSLARRAKHVYGYEVVPEAIADAQNNAKLNGISNATFVQGDLNKINEPFGKEFPKPDIIISDPNRPGMHLKLIKWLLEVKAPRVVYVSCNPATCARDLDYLCHGVEDKDLKGCYKLKTSCSAKGTGRLSIRLSYIAGNGYCFHFCDRSTKCILSYQITWAL
ncbi:hypothetical protein GUJ93_ZPchr0001g32039 [Zizania palustris]|uniref:Methyltransferase domain-containing protein n=1 Tax=Zizania palustris TaxID=103762 RepID=A0A8J5VAK0_ZIZPA|nr:hypothetical protein GUJ93_ZPchr0001g32039 [Zizania palustris]